MAERGLLFVMTGASGVGKDTIWQAALPSLPNLSYAVSATTRTQRPGEIHGQHYHFYERAAFQRLIAEGALVEFAEYAGDYYGTPRQQLEAMLASGRDALVKPELMGARQIKRRLPEAVMIFIAPPSMGELKRRLKGRGTDSPARIEQRLARAREEIAAVREFEYVIINDALETAVRDFCSIIYAERARSKRLTDADIARFLHEA